MPKAAPRPCSFHCCNTLVSDGSGRCVKHPRTPWIKTKPVKRITGRRLQALIAETLSRDPLCVECARQGRVIASKERDHIIPLEEGGPDEQSNTQGLCKSCHAAKSKLEAKRGQYHRA